MKIAAEQQNQTLAPTIQPVTSVCIGILLVVLKDIKP